MQNDEASIERAVRDLLKGISPDHAAIIDTLDPRARLWEVVDSLSLLDLVAGVEERYQMTIEVVDVIPENFRTIEAIVRFVENPGDRS